MNKKIFFVRNVSDQDWVYSLFFSKKFLGYFSKNSTISVMFLGELQFRAAARIEQEKGMYTNLRCCSRTSDLLVDSIFCVYLYELCIHFYNSQSLESEQKKRGQLYIPVVVYYLLFLAIFSI